MRAVLYAVAGKWLASVFPILGLIAIPLGAIMFLVILVIGIEEHLPQGLKPFPNRRQNLAVVLVIVITVIGLVVAYSTK